MKRRELFSSLASSFKKDEKQEKIIRPPYFEHEELFIKECQNCDGLCASSCEVNIIQIQKDKTPKLDFSSSGCTFCDECAKVCPSDVLKLEYKKNIALKVEINILECLSWNQTMCFSCKDPCLDDAIKFLGMFRPEIDDSCTSCGFCLNVCPTNAIKIG